MLRELRETIDSMILGLSEAAVSLFTAVQNRSEEPLILWITGLVLSALAAVAIAIKSLQKSRRKLALHTAVGERFLQSTSAKELINILFDITSKQLKADFLALYLVPRDGEKLLLRAQRGTGPNTPEWEKELPMDALLTGAAGHRVAGVSATTMVQIGESGLIMAARPGASPRLPPREQRFLSGLLGPVASQLAIVDTLSDQAETSAGAILASSSSSLLLSANLDPDQLAGVLLDSILRPLNDTVGFIGLSKDYCCRERVEVVAINGLESSQVEEILSVVDTVDLPPLLRRESSGDSLVIAMRRGGYRDWLATPVVGPNGKIGIIFICATEHEFLPAQEKMLQANASRLSLSIRNQRYHRAVNEDYRHTLETIVLTMESASTTSFGHSNRVSRMSGDLAESAGLSDKDKESVCLAGLLHDVGMAGVTIDPAVGTGQLSAPDYDLVKQHPRIGALLAAPLQRPVPIAPIILHHHERFDGFGYPSGLKGNSIPIGARIVGLSEVFDAMMTAREYREALGFDDAISRLRQLSGTQLDPELVDCFEALATREWWYELCRESHSD